MASMATNWQVLAPLLAVAAAAIGVIALKAIVGEHTAETARVRRRPDRLGLLLALICSAALAIAGVSAYVPLITGQTSAFVPMLGVYRMDGLTAVGTLLVCGATLLTIWASSTHLIVRAIEQAETYALLLLSLCGMLLCLGAESTPLLYLGVELMSLPLYALAGFDPRSRNGQEASLKLMIGGAVASATLLYGLTLLYGATGETALSGLHAQAATPSALSLAGFGLLCAGLLAKAALVPFHGTAPDALEGAPTPFAGFLAVAPVITVLCVLVRWLGADTFVLGSRGAILFSALSIASVVVGSLMALLQTGFARMLAYTTIAHAGILAIAFVPHTPVAYAALLFGLLAHLLCVIGLFCLMTSLGTRTHSPERIDDLTGLGLSHPLLGAAASLFLLGLAGVPGTIGFWSRFLVFSAAIESGALAAVLIATLGSVVLVANALRVISVFYTAPDAGDSAGEPGAETGLTLRATSPASNELGVLIVCAVLVVGLGFMPEIVLPGQDLPLTTLLLDALN